MDVNKLADNRQLFVDTAKKWLGYNELNGSHKKIIDVYNTIRPLPVGYRMPYDKDWCAAFVSAVAQQCKLTDIVYPECGCERMINLYKAKGFWQEDDAYIPKPGDLVFYDWGDSGVGDNTSFADHVGIVYSVSGDTIKLIEGNISSQVGYKNLKVNARYIRGYATPNFEPKATPSYDLTKVVDEVIAGKWGNGAARAAALKEAGYDADVVQEAVNARFGAGNSSTCTVTLPVLKQGDKSDAVKSLQRLLIAAGEEIGPDGADGEFGTNTLKAVINFQNKHRLTERSVVKQLTWSKLILR